LKGFGQGRLQRDRVNRGITVHPFLLNRDRNTVAGLDNEFTLIGTVNGNDNCCSVNIDIEQVIKILAHSAMESSGFVFEA
jgi:hypothetical protein